MVPPPPTRNVGLFGLPPIGKPRAIPVAQWSFGHPRSVCSVWLLKPPPAPPSTLNKMNKHHFEPETLNETERPAPNPAAGWVILMALFWVWVAYLFIRSLG